MVMRGLNKISICCISEVKSLNDYHRFTLSALVRLNFYGESFRSHRLYSGHIGMQMHASRIEQ